MIKKRIVGVITVKNGLAVQSFGYNHYLPLGSPEYLVENLDRWGADEILVQSIDRTRCGLGPDFSLLDRLGSLGLSTPLVYAGGIRSADDAVEVVRRGADRVVVDGLIHVDAQQIERISNALGAQGIIACLPLTILDGTCVWYNYQTKTHSPIPESILSIFERGQVLEVLVVDWMHEGIPGTFDSRLIKAFPLPHVQLIAFGGVGQADNVISLLNKSNVSAIAIGNSLSYSEHAIQKLRVRLDNMVVRMPNFER